MSETRLARRQGDETTGRIVARVAGTIGAARFERYFGDGRVLRLDEQCLKVSVASGFLAGVLDRQFRDLLRDAVRAETGHDAMDVRFVVDEEAALRPHGDFPRVEKPSKKPGSESPARRAAKASGLGRPGTTTPRFELEHFVVGATNRLAFDAAVRLVEGEETASLSPLFLHGPCGMGKSHLLQGAASMARKRDATAVVRLTTAEAFVNEFIGAVRAKRVEPFRKHYRTADLLCIDDLAGLEGKTATQLELLHTLDAVMARGGRVCVAACDHPRKVRGLSEALVSRLMGGLVTVVGAPEGSLREKIVRACASRRGMVLDDAGVRVIAEAGWSNSALPGAASSVRDLEGAVMKVEAMHRLVSQGGEKTSAGWKVGLMTIQQALGPAGPAAPSRSGGAKPPVRFETILHTVCSHVGVQESEVLARGRHASVVLARSVCALVARRTTRMSFPEIARGLGRSNHSTVVTACQRLERQMREGLRVFLEAHRGESTLAELCDLLCDQVRRTA